MDAGPGVWNPIGTADEKGKEPERGSREGPRGTAGEELVLGNRQERCSGDCFSSFFFGISAGVPMFSHATCPLVVTRSLAGSRARCGESDIRRVVQQR